jgi:hypothetical protein
MRNIEELSPRIRRRCGDVIDAFESSCAAVHKAAVVAARFVHAQLHIAVKNGGAGRAAALKEIDGQEGRLDLCGIAYCEVAHHREPSHHGVARNRAAQDDRLFFDARIAAHIST